MKTTAAMVEISSALTTTGGAEQLTHLDRSTIAEIIQGLPSDAYTLAFRFRESDNGGNTEDGDGDWYRGVIGDLTGHDVITLVEAGDVCLCLPDIADLARHAHPALASWFPVATSTGHEMLHGLLIASPGIEVSFPHGLRHGALMPIEGDARLSLRDDGADLAPAQAVTLDHGRFTDWRDRTVDRLEVGPSLFIGLTRLFLDEAAAPEKAAARVGKAVFGWFRHITEAPSGWQAIRLKSGTGATSRSSTGLDGARLFRLMRNHLPKRRDPDTRD